MRGSVEIAGGGLAGMTIAAALAQRGCDVRVHERRTDLREEGGGIGLNEFALRALDVLGVTDEAMRDGAALRHADMRDHRQRVHMSADFYASHGRHYAVSRYCLHRALMTAAIEAGAEIRTSSAVVAASTDGTLSLEDGSSASADLVVAADGIGSRVRDSSGIKCQIRDLKHNGLRVALDYEMPEAEDGFLYERWNGTKRVGYVRLGDGRAAVYMSCPARELAGELPRNVDGWARALPEQAELVNRAIREGALWAPFSNVVCSAWSHGRVVLIGDAAHAMPPHRGQGGALAIQDAVVLAEHLMGVSDLRHRSALDAVIKQWELAVRPEVELAQKSSVMFCRAQSLWPRPLLALRPAFLRAVIRHRTPNLRGIAGSNRGGRSLPAAEG